jgi:hypothetical protein
VGPSFPSRRASDLFSTQLNLIWLVLRATAVVFVGVAGIATAATTGTLRNEAAKTRPATPAKMRRRMRFS